MQNIAQSFLSLELKKLSKSVGGDADFQKHCNLKDPWRARQVTALVKQLGRWISTFSWCPVSVPSCSVDGKPKESAWSEYLSETPYLRTLTQLYTAGSLRYLLIQSPIVPNITKHTLYTPKINNTFYISEALGGLCRRLSSIEEVLRKFASILD